MVRDQRAPPQILRSDATHERACGGDLRRSHDLTLDQRRDAGDAGDSGDFCRLSVEIAERTGLGIDTEVAVETENPAEQVGAKAIHHRHDDDQGGNPKRDPEQREDRDYRDKPLLPSRPQITKRDHPLECAEDHAGGALLKSRSPGRALFPRKCPAVPRSGGV